MSENEGHIVAAVFEDNLFPTIVVGVYGNSDSSDRASLAVIEELRLFLTGIVPHLPDTTSFTCR
jgi:hypothetical protein